MEILTDKTIYSFWRV